jgi:hypothetical protein
VSRGLRLRVNLADSVGHFKASNELSIARFATHPSFPHAMRLVGCLEASPCRRQFVPDLMRAVDTYLLGMRCSRVAKSDAALLGDALADLIHINDWHSERGSG